MKHFFYSLLILIGMRDRLRCPRCTAVGTYKPHGSVLFDNTDTRKVPRWLCKFCGYYKGREGEKNAYPDSKIGSWQFKNNLNNDLTPAEVLHKHYGDNMVWPWKG